MSDALMLNVRAESLLALRRYREAAADVEQARKLEPDSQPLAELATRVASAMRTK